MGALNATNWLETDRLTVGNWSRNCLSLRPAGFQDSGSGCLNPTLVGFLRCGALLGIGNDLVELGVAVKRFEVGVAIEVQDGSLS
jgi:hypothetical protein